MMRLWKISYSKTAPMTGAGTLSAVAHVVIITAWVLATEPLATMARESLANRVYYIPPVDKPQVAYGTREVVHFITLAPGPGEGPGPATVDAQQPVRLAQHTPAAGATVDTVAKPVPPGDPHGDSVFTVLEVDSAVVRTQNSAAPAYPLDLLNKHIEGVVTARYIVDTTGYADAASLEVLSASNPGFTVAVRDALPYMRFSPAKIGSTKVRQLVQQSFTFRITPPIASTPKP